MHIISYRNQLPKDIERKVSELFLQVFNSPPRNEDWSLRTAIDFIGSHYGRSSLFSVCFDGDEPIGFCFGLSIADSQIKTEILEHAGVISGFYISAIGLNSKSRKMGFGKSLLMSFIDDVSREYLLCVLRVHEQAPEAVALFERCGFYRVGQQRSEVGGMVANRFFYAKELQLRGLKLFHFEGIFSNGDCKMFAVPGRNRQEAEDKLKSSSAGLENIFMIEVGRYD